MNATRQGPLAFQGLGLHHPWYTQEIEHFSTLLSELSNATQTGKLLRASLEQLLLETGLDGPLGKHNFKTFHSLTTNTWVSLVWRTSTEFGITFNHPIYHLPLLRENDAYLMQAFAQAGYKGKDLAILSRCRMFIKATTLADIVTIDGKAITSWAFDGKSSNNIRPHVQWPRQPDYLTSHYWRLWKTALTKPSSPGIEAPTPEFCHAPFWHGIPIRSRYSLSGAIGTHRRTTKFIVVRASCGQKRTPPADAKDPGDLDSRSMGRPFGNSLHTLIA